MSENLHENLFIMTGTSLVVILILTAGYEKAIRRLSHRVTSLKSEVATAEHLIGELNTDNWSLSAQRKHARAAAAETYVHMAQLHAEIARLTDALGTPGDHDDVPSNVISIDRHQMALPFNVVDHVGNGNND